EKPVTKRAKQRCNHSELLWTRVDEIVDGWADTNGSGRGGAGKRGTSVVVCEHDVFEWILLRSVGREHGGVASQGAGRSDSGLGVGGADGCCSAGNDESGSGETVIQWRRTNDRRGDSACEEIDG